MATFTIKSSKNLEVINITSTVEEIVAKSGVKEGICLVFAPHATAAIIMNEDEPNLKSDFLYFFDLIRQLVPHSSWAHNKIDDNTEAHLFSSFIGQSVAIPISNSRLVRGTWQEIQFVELDGPRERKVVVVCK